LCRTYGVAAPEQWWARALLFDALIGNTDRHPENWGLFLRQVPQSLPGELPSLRTLPKINVSLAPIFDNATSLGYEILESNIPALLDSGSLERYISRGSHHAGWAPGDDSNRGHFALCRQFCEAVPDLAGDMGDLLRFDFEEVVSEVEECVEFRAPLQLSRQRKELILRMIQMRKEALSCAIGE
jgi:hypothetical protein